MLRTITIVALLLTVAAPSSARQASATPPPSERAGQQLQEIKDRLALTPDQIEQLRPVFTEEVQKVQALRDKYKGDTSRRTRLKMARELRSIQDGADEQLKKILTKPQMDEMKKIRAERREQLKRRAQKG
jgi:Spy/CpxP family protein refolding chaperone